MARNTPDIAGILSGYNENRGEMYVFGLGVGREGGTDLKDWSSCFYSPPQAEIFWDPALLMIY